MTAAIPGQLAIIADLRWRMFVNGLRSRRGKMELASRIIVTVVFAGAGLAGFIGAAVTSWFLIYEDKPEFLAFAFWAVFFWWQSFPVMATAFTNNPDSSELLRFPLTYRSFFIVRLAYGLFDPASALGSVVLLGVFLGVSFARPLLSPWAFLVLAIFGFFNLALMQTVFAWLERWLAQRRTREILGVFFILFMLSFQLIGPLSQHFGRRPGAQIKQTAAAVAKVQAAFPPGLAADAVAQASHSQYLSGLTSLLLLGATTAAVTFLLHLRLRKQFRGENLSEAGARAATPVSTRAIALGWNLPGFPPAVATVFEKEMRYLARSGPMLLTLIMPIFMLLLFRLGPANPMRHSGFFNRAPNTAFPSAAAYSLLLLTNLVCNSFGGESGGMQFFYASPVTFRQIVLGKNLMHATILLVNTALAWIAVATFYGPPSAAVTVATLTAVLFAAPLNFTAGNLLSLYAPKKRDFSTFGRQNASQLTVLVSFGVQIFLVGIGAGVFIISRLYGNDWIAAGLFALLAIVSLAVYAYMMRIIDSYAFQRREVMLAEVCRA